MPSSTVNWPGQGPAGHVLGGEELGVLLVTEGDSGIGGDVEQRGPQHFLVLGWRNVPSRLVRLRN
jgi:hypothetical protein